MEESPSACVPLGKITGITFSLATRQEICKPSISECAITHASQLSNPYLGLPLEVGKCEACGTSEPGQCEGHFGYIELPIPVYHPDHVGELKRLLSLLCLKCLKIKNRKTPVKNPGVIERMLATCCEDVSQVTVDLKSEEGASYLILKVPSRKTPKDFWNFLEKYGFRYGGDKNGRPLLASEVMTILRKIPADTKKKLVAKGYFPQEGYVLQYLPVPPNCLSVPDVSDGTNIMSRDHSLSLLKRVLKQIELIKNSRNGMPNFDSHHIEANDLQTVIAQYFEFRGTGKASRDVDNRFGVNKESNTSSTKAWLDKMKTLFIRKSSGFSSRSVITGDPFIGVNEIGLPFEIAQKITFEERVSQNNVSYLQKLVDEKLCLTYRDGMSTYSLREGSKGHTFLRLGQVVHRRIMDGDMVFINRPPTTHKHSLQALRVYIHDDHTVKINPLICGPLGADFDGDCIHLFYPQCLAARAEVLELFSVEKQLLSSHTGNFNLQLTTDSSLSLKMMFKKYFFGRVTAQQLMMFLPRSLPEPALLKYCRSGPLWTVLQVLQAALPPSFDGSGERYLSYKNELVKFDFNRDLVHSTFTDIVSSILFTKGPKEVISYFNCLTPMLMDSLHSDGFSLCLRDFYIPKASIQYIQESLRSISKLLNHLDSSESVQMQINNHLRGLRLHISNSLLSSSAIGFLIDSKSESALSKVVQQIGFLGMQLSNKGQYYSKTLVSDLALLFQRQYPSSENYPSEEFGLVRSCLFRGLDPHQEMVHSISSREVIVRSSRGLTEPGTLFKNLMAILRDVVICYDGTVRNVCTNSIIQFEYGTNGFTPDNEFGAGEPVGVLAATAMSNPAYKAVLDSSPSSNSSWEMMKEILLCSVNFKNDVSDRRVRLYLNDCGCGWKHCVENAACTVRNHLKKVSLKDAATELLIEYREQSSYASSENDIGVVGHVHLNEELLKRCNVTMNEILSSCEHTISSLRKGKKTALKFKRITVDVSECCSFEHSSKCKPVPCLTILQGTSNYDLEERCHFLAEEICPPLLETVIKGNPRVSSVDINWISPDSPTWIKSPHMGQKGELVVDVVLEKHSVKHTGDSWRVVMDSCLPVMHLIDTKRSIPYAIKQVQDLLGISCAFEQAIQRLSTSVTMVTKGVLKDHLVLLANSMTYSGNLTGFNIGGIKALSQSLNVQIPFMQATLSAPRKCFERAAEKCHVDSLSSIVASCAWGKQVAVGTGSAFDLLLDTRKVELREPDGIDVYDFLQMVRGASTGEETSTACLGAEIEDLDLDDERLQYDTSPVRDSDQPTFEDTLELNEHDWNKDPAPMKELSGGWEQASKGQSNEGGWEQASKGQSNGGGWEQVGKGQSNEEGWGQVRKSQSNGEVAIASDAGSSGWGKAAVSKDNTVKEDPRSSQWNAKKTEGSSNQSGSSAWEKETEIDWNTPNTGTCDWEITSNKAHGAAPDSARSSRWDKKEPSNAGKEWGSSSALGRAFDSERISPTFETSAGWDHKSDKAETGDAWNQKIDKAQTGTAGTTSDSAWSGWGNATEDSSSKKEPQFSSDRNDCHRGETKSWGKQSGPSSSWQKKVDPVQKKDDWEKAMDDGLTVEAHKSVSDAGWSSKLGQPECTSKQSESLSFNNWNKKTDKGLNVESPKSATSSDWSRWGQDTSEKAVPSPPWGKPIDSKGDSPLAAKTSGGKQPGPSSPWQKRLDPGRSSSVDGWKKTMDEGQNVEAHKSVSHEGWSSKLGEPESASKQSESFSFNCSNKKIDKGMDVESPISATSSGWSSWGQNTSEKVVPSSAWGKSIDSKGDSPLAAKTSGDWKQPAEEVNNVVTGRTAVDLGGWDAKVSDKQAGSSWGKSVPSNDPWSKKDEHQVSASQMGEIRGDFLNKDIDGSTRKGEDSLKSDFERSRWGNKRDAQSQWGQRKGSKGEPNKNYQSWGSPINRDCKRGTDHTAKTFDNSRGSGGFTLTRQPLDLFTEEERDILGNIEQTMQKIRNIMQAGYNDGDPLSADDQSYIADNVLNYHPDKASKIGAGIKYIMISKHEDFQDTRCFFVVSTDDKKQDFSYRKSLENFTRETYPDKAEGFVAKYFRKSGGRPPRPGPGWTREQPPSSDADNGAKWTREQPPSTDADNGAKWAREQPPSTDADNGAKWTREQPPSPDADNGAKWTREQLPSADDGGANTEQQ